MKFILWTLIILPLTIFNAQATVITYNLNTEFSGASSPTGPAPWLTASFDDEDTAGSVKLTLDSSGLSNSEFVTEWDFAFNPGKTLASLVFTPDAGNTRTADSIATGADAFKADGAGFFDISFEYANGPPGARFAENIVLMYDITGIADLIASDFDFLSTASSKGQFTTAAHIQGIGPGADFSGWIAPDGGGGGGGGGGPDPIPEPSTFILLGGGLIGLAYWRRKRG